MICLCIGPLRHLGEGVYFILIKIKENLMKKVLAAAAAAILCFSLSACGTSKQEGNGNGVTYTYKDQTITMKAPPKRIIELSAPLTLIAFFFHSFANIFFKI